MVRVSFRFGLLAGFILIVALLGGAALRSWLVVEAFVERSRQNGDEALQVAALIQDLGERTIDIERSVRQYLVLHELTVRQRFDEHFAQAMITVDRLESFAAKPLRVQLSDWREQAAQLQQGLDQGVSREGLVPIMGRLVDRSSLLKAAGQHWIDSRNSELFAQLEAARTRLAAQIGMALAASFLVVLAVGWWFMRPLRQLERAIARLGESRFDSPVSVGGPADLVQIGGQLDWLRKRLAELEAHRERTLRHVSHELKTPLTALREGVALLRDEVPGPLGSAQREVVDILEHNVLGLQRQIEGLLSVNASLPDGGPQVRRPVALRPFLHEVVRRRELHSQARSLALHIEAPERTVLLDSEKLAVIVDNLLSNAIDFSPERGEISLRAKLAAGRLVLDIVDQGPGIAPEDVERIFEPFVQGRRSASIPRQGSGVGLSIVRELVRALGGVVHVVPGSAGAHLRVELPHD